MVGRGRDRRVGLSSRASPVITIREAAPADADALAELRWEFRAGRQAPLEAHEAFVERCAGWMRRELTAGAPWRAWVAVRNNRIIGQIWLDVIQKIPNPIDERERHAYLSNVYVQPAERGGIGSKLLEAALDWTAVNGVDRIVLWPSKRSVTLYQRHGFTRDGDVMELIHSTTVR
jgi:GNAT superfamily N-acetyltransferase